MISPKASRSPPVAGPSSAFMPFRLATAKKLRWSSSPTGFLRRRGGLKIFCSRLASPDPSATLPASIRSGVGPGPPTPRGSPGRAASRTNEPRESRDGAKPPGAASSLRAPKRRELPGCSAPTAVSAARTRFFERTRRANRRVMPEDPAIRKGSREVSKQIVFNCTPQETRVALLENGEPSSSIRSDGASAASSATSTRGRSFACFRACRRPSSTSGRQGGVPLRHRHLSISRTSTSATTTRRTTRPRPVARRGGGATVTAHRTSQPPRPERRTRRAAREEVEHAEGADPGPGEAGPGDPLPRSPRADRHQGRALTSHVTIPGRYVVLMPTIDPSASAAASATRPSDAGCVRSSTRAGRRAWALSSAPRARPAPRPR